MSATRLNGLRAVLLVCLVVGFLAVGMPEAATWHVTPDPAHPEDRVGAVAAQAASGDTILIEPGVYYEHIPLEGKSLTFMGVGGAGGTVLDGGRSLPGREGSIIYTLSGAPADLTLEGLTLRNGTGARYSEFFDTIGGGAVLWWSAGTHRTASITVVGCVFEDNSTGGQDNLLAAGGGAILAESLGSVWIERCSFSGNASHEQGGDLCIFAENATALECDFQIDRGSWSGGSSIHHFGLGKLTIRECAFRADMGGGRWCGILTEASRVEIIDSRFIDFGSPLATRIEITFEGVGAPPQEVLVSGNLFWSAAGPDSAAEPSLLVSLPNGAYTVRGNTFVRCGVFLASGTGSRLVFRNNIIARGSLDLLIAPGGSLECNAFWRTAVIDRWGNLTQESNTTADPLFCDEAQGDFTLSEGSPCAPYSPPHGECDLIGARPVSCVLDVLACCVGQECRLVTEAECGVLGGEWMSDPPRGSCEPSPCLTPALESTWGAIKAMFRER